MKIFSLFSILSVILLVKCDELVEKRKKQKLVFLNQLKKGFECVSSELAHHMFLQRPQL